jgi:hypothetical protein
MEDKNVEGVEEKDNVLFQVDGYTASVENLKTSLDILDSAIEQRVLRGR